MWVRVGLVRIEVSEKHVASILQGGRNQRPRNNVNSNLTRTKRRHIPVDGILRSRRHENLNPCTKVNLPYVNTHKAVNLNPCTKVNLPYVNAHKAIHTFLAKPVFLVLQSLYFCIRF
jgi:hypothetical protein